MKRTITMLAAMLLALSMMALPAMADEAKTLEQLEQELQDAKAEVERLEGEVSDLEDAIEEKQGEVDAQQKVVDALNEDLDDAKADLAAAKVVRDGLQADYDACNPATSGQNNGNSCRNAILTPGGTGPLADANADVVTKDGLVADAQQAVEEAEEDLGELQGELDGLNASLELTGAQLDLAKEAVIEAQAALDAYVAAPAHPGCTGINNAKAKVAKNVPVKSNANTALATVSEKLGCGA